MMGEKITGLTCMYYNVRFSDGPTFGEAGTSQFKFLKILFYKHDKQKAVVYTIIIYRLNILVSACKADPVK
jgi:hypothetical protein